MTKYSMEILNAATNSWTPVALFSDFIPVPVLADLGRTLWNNIDEADNVAILEVDTGVVVWDHNDDTWQDEPAYLYDECGFDPYEGCYTFDC